jgi:hypothetical protein
MEIRKVVKSAQRPRDEWKITGNIFGRDFLFWADEFGKGIAESLWKRGPLKKATGILLGIVTKLVKKGQIRS